MCYEISNLLYCQSHCNLTEIAKGFLTSKQASQHWHLHKIHSGKLSLIVLDTQNERETETETEKERQTDRQREKEGEREGERDRGLETFLVTQH